MPARARCALHSSFRWLSADSEGAMDAGPGQLRAHFLRRKWAKYPCHRPQRAPSRRSSPMARSATWLKLRFQRTWLAPQLRCLSTPSLLRDSSSGPVGPLGRPFQSIPSPIGLPAPCQIRIAMSMHARRRPSLALRLSLRPCA